MSVLRVIRCDVPGCGTKCTESEPNAGWQGWGALNGVELNGVANPNLCPAHLAQVAEFLDTLTGDTADGVD